MLDDVIPAPHFRERHERRIAAAPAAGWEARHALRLGDLALSRTLMGIEYGRRGCSSGIRPFPRCGR